MRIHKRNLDKGFVYACSKRDAKEIFGEAIAESVSFGTTPDHQFERSVSRCPDIHGTVIMSVHASRWNWQLKRMMGFEPAEGEVVPSTSVSVYMYRVRSEHFTDLLPELFKDILIAQVVPWAKSKLARPETAVFGPERLLIELHQGKLLVHEMRSS